jgi:ankyrin repeat protein
VASVLVTQCRDATAAGSLGRSALMWAASEGGAEHLELARWLVSEGADVRCAMASSGKTALMLAAEGVRSTDTPAQLTPPLN